MPMIKFVGDYIIILEFQIYLLYTGIHMLMLSYKYAALHYIYVNLSKKKKRRYDYIYIKIQPQLGSYIISIRLCLVLS